MFHFELDSTIMKRVFLITVFGIFCIVSIVTAQDNKQDVIYLKTGNVIRGTIIEQVPNTSIKIQTRDGSVFDVEMQDVAIITKEPPVCVGGCKRPGIALTLSLVGGVLFPINGIGQWYNGEGGKGFAFLGAGFLSELAMRHGGDTYLIGLVSYIIIYIWAADDSWRSAKRINRERGYANLPQYPMLGLMVNKSENNKLNMGIRVDYAFGSDK